MDDPRARVQLLATHLQEDPENLAVQLGGGPAHGPWQFEGGPMSATAQILLHAGAQTAHVCDALGLPCDRQSIYGALATNFVLAAACARLNYWTDAHPLPALGDSQGAWDCYVRNWRPGRPRPEHWHANYAAALAAVEAYAAVDSAPDSAT